LFKVQQEGLMSSVDEFKKGYPPIRWDAHVCPPLKVNADLSFLQRYKNAGVDFVSLNVGFDLTSQAESFELIEYFHCWIQTNNFEYSLVSSLKQIYHCKSQNKLAIAFDIEGCNLLNGDLDMVSKLYSLGVKQMVFAYNNCNSAGGGCFGIDGGLTNFGKKLVSKCNQVGMVIDCSHVGYATTMDIINFSEHPVVFSHSNSFAIKEHPRNIKDAQIYSCAQKGGVIGVNGIGIFLGDHNDTRTIKIVEHIDYIVQKVGSNHVGIGLDCVFDLAEVQAYVKSSPSMFPDGYGFENVLIAQPEQFLELKELLALRGYSSEAINNILGDNFARVASQVWK
jgi:membrane dipeptidase